MVGLLAQQDLNRGTSKPAGAVSSSQVSTNLLTNNTFDIGSIDISAVVIWVNLFALAFTIFYSLILLTHFFNKRIFYGGGEYSNEKEGMRGIYKAIKISLTYVYTIPFLLIFGYVNTNFPTFSLVAGILMIIIYIAKIIVDIPIVLSVFEYFSWANSLAKSLSSLVKFKKK